jgi:hypothetical protein
MPYVANPTHFKNNMPQFLANIDIIVHQSVAENMILKNIWN